MSGEDGPRQLLSGRVVQFYGFVRLMLPDDARRLEHVLARHNRWRQYEIDAFISEKQVPRGYITCDYFIVTHRIIDYDIF